MVECGRLSKNVLSRFEKRRVVYLCSAMLSWVLKGGFDTIIIASVRILGFLRLIVFFAVFIFVNIVFIFVFGEMTSILFPLR